MGSKANIYVLSPSCHRSQDKCNMEEQTDCKVWRSNSYSLPRGLIGVSTASGNWEKKKVCSRCPPNSHPSLRRQKWELNQAWQTCQIWTMADLRQVWAKSHNNIFNNVSGKNKWHRPYLGFAPVKHIRFSSNLLCCFWYFRFFSSLFF